VSPWLKNRGEIHTSKARQGTAKTSEGLTPEQKKRRGGLSSQFGARLIYLWHRLGNNANENTSGNSFISEVKAGDSKAFIHVEKGSTEMILTVSPLGWKTSPSSLIRGSCGQTCPDTHREKRIQRHAGMGSGGGHVLHLEAKRQWNSWGRWEN